jgi:ATP-dependent DNA helicase RecQ
MEQNHGQPFRQWRHVAGRPAARRKQVDALLHSVFGVARLRDGQQRVIDSVLEGRDTLAIMPTGSGKSLCYQIPAAILDGATIVVSPLIALMKDQLDKLEEVGISAAQMNSSLTRGEQRDAAAGSGMSGDEVLPVQV